MILEQLVQRWGLHKGSRNLYAQLYSDENLTEAWHKVRTNGDTPGVDGVTIPIFERRLFLNLKTLQRELQTRRYQPQPVKQIFISKSDGRLRPLGILTVRDRVAQRAALHVIEPLFEPHFEDCSFAFRPERSIQMALDHTTKLIHRGSLWVADLDIQSCFDTINLDRLLDFIGEKVKDQELLRLLRAWLYADSVRISRNGLQRKEKRTLGLIQGAILSPLLANIYLDRFDKEALKRGLQVVRYADDILILCRTKAEAEQALTTARELLAQLDLQINPQKTRIIPLDKGLRFLGEEVRRWSECAQECAPQPTPAGSMLIDWTQLLKPASLPKEV